MGIIEVVPEILAFGSFGLAFLMAYLGYRLLRAEVGVTERPPSGPILGVICFFLIVSIGLMIAAGFFEHSHRELELSQERSRLELSQERSRLELSQKPVNLIVRFPHSIPKNIDPPKIQVGSETHKPNEEQFVLIAVKEDQQVLVMLESLVDAIEELRRKAVWQVKNVSDSNEVGIGDDDQNF